MRRLVVLLVFVCAAAAAEAAPAPSYVTDNLGEWLIAPETGKPGCRIVLKGERVGKTWRALPGPECRERVPQAASASSWDFESGVRLFDSGGKLLLAFAEDETTLMKTSFETPPVHLLVRAKAGVEAAPHAPSLVGEWILRRPGGPPLCALTLARDPKAGEADLTLKTASPCDPAVARLKLNGARVEDFRLMLYGTPDTSLGFEPSGPEAFAKAEGGRPLEMVRKPRG